jgi:hypothetical protein
MHNVVKTAPRTVTLEFSLPATDQLLLPHLGSGVLYVKHHRLGAIPVCFFVVNMS